MLAKLDFLRFRVLVTVLLALGACRPVLPSAAPVPDADPRVARVLAGLRPAVEAKGEEPVRWTLAERMAHYRTPGVSIAVVDGGRIAWALGFGVKEAGGNDPVTPATLFQAASISKPVAALATLRLVQEGKLSLDANVNDSLKSWKVPDNELTQKEKVTLRRIMSHTAGLTVHGFGGFAADEPVPTMLQILDGIKPAKNPPVRVEAVPGSRFQYSGGGTTVMQLLVSEVTGMPYPELLDKTVLEPIGMMHSTFEQPLPASLAPQAAAAHDETGATLPGKWHAYPMTAPAGLWTTPSDLARLILEVQNTYTGKSSRVVNQSSMRQMLTVVLPPYGLGFSLEGTGQNLRFSHNGSNDGYLATLTGYAERGEGAVVMMNASNPELLFEIIRAIAAEYRWPDKFSKEVEAVRLTSEQIARVVGDYRLTAAPDVTRAHRERRRHDVHPCDRRSEDAAAPDVRLDLCADLRERRRARGLRRGRTRPEDRSPRRGLRGRAGAFRGE
jgi:CubicO group peptidase (beta-lactamase class C family)